MPRSPLNAPQTYLQAALLRLSARLGSGLADGAAVLSELARDAPEKLQQELELFWQEVEAEAERLERGAAPHANEVPGERPADAGASAQDQIDALRARVAQLNRRLEEQG